MVVTRKKRKVMKRYLYLLLAVVALCTACKESSSEVVVEQKVEFHFGEMSVATTPTTATITAEKPYITVGDKRVDEGIIVLHYIGAGHDIVEYVEEYSEEAGNIIFQLSGLTPQSEYEAYLGLAYKEYGKEYSDKVRFTTEKLHEKVTAIHYETEIEAKGVMATINLSEISYTCDDEAVEIDVLEVGYARKGASEWISKQFSGASITEGALSVEIPYDGEEYLEDNSDYLFRLTFYPADGTLNVITSSENEFKTPYAEVTADIAAPTLSRNAKMIEATVEDIEIYYDGVKEHNYKYSTAAEYLFYYRAKGSEEWVMVKTSATNDKMSATLPAEEGNTYEVKAVIFAGKESTMIESSTSEITIAPTPPPVTGGGDTSAVAGTWHLTQWRGAVPSFDIYLSITEDGIVTLWQRLESREWECYYSSAAIEDGVIMGTYSDGVAWGASYIVTLDDEETMTWVSTLDSSDISVYTRAELPENLTDTRAITRVQSEARFL